MIPSQFFPLGYMLKEGEEKIINEAIEKGLGEKSAIICLHHQRAL